MRLLLAIHNHQPVGNFDHVFALATDQSYSPFLRLLERSPHVRCALHFSGPLLEWIEANRREVIDLVRALVERGQVEMLGGGFYEPMLAVLPERDAAAQLGLMSDYLADRFGQRPIGMWLAERVWEPDLPRLIARAGTGLRYTLLDETHFRNAGLTAARLGGYYLTEKAGAVLALFPIDKGLRYAIPFRPPHEVIDDLLALAEGAEPLRAVTYGDDGEKFGVWPGTREWVWDKGWLASFFQMLADIGDRVVTAPPGEWLRAEPAVARVYPPTASYEEMAEWSLPAAAIPAYNELVHEVERRADSGVARAFVRGGIWQGFLAKYPEANALHKRTIEVGDLLARAEAAGGAELPEARRALFRSQCNCGYWHGLFGGLYLSSLRHALYANLLEAEGIAAAVLAAAGGQPYGAAETDLFVEGRPQILVRTPALKAVVMPAAGGALAELSSLPHRFNLLNVLARHPEAYHRQLRELAARQAAADGRGATAEKPTEGGKGGAAEEADGIPTLHEIVPQNAGALADVLLCDAAPRLSLVERFLDPAADLRAVKRGQGFVGGAAPARRVSSIGEAPGRIDLVYAAAGVPLRVRKRLAFAAERAALRCTVALESLSRAPVRVRPAIELNVTLLAPDAPDRTLSFPGAAGAAAGDHRPCAEGVVAGAERIRLENGWDRFALQIAAPGAEAVWRYPIETVSHSEAGFERTYQGTCLLLVYAETEIGPAGCAHVVDLAIEDLRGAGGKG